MTKPYHAGDVPGRPTHPSVLAETMDSIVVRPRTLGAAARMSNYLPCPVHRRLVPINWRSDRWGWTEGAFPIPLTCGHNLRSPHPGRRGW